MSEASKRPIYGNWRVLSPCGDLMFRSEDKRVQWYLKRNLAQVVSDNPPTIRLSFEPSGQGHAGDDYYLNDKDNRCVVCGASDSLTKHHVVPRCYRKYFPEELKSHRSHDVMAVCIPCHDLYEKHAQQLKQVIAAETGVPPASTDLLRVRRAASALLCGTVPEERRKELLTLLQVHFGMEKVSEEQIKSASSLSCSSGSHGQAVVKKTQDLEAFVRRWRHHFLSTMQPRFLPEGWSADRAS